MKNRLNIYSTIFLSLFFLSCNSTALFAVNSVFSNDYDIIGIDISKHQGEIDFEKVKSTGIIFIFIRATDGITYQDSTFKSNFTSARAAGLTVGAYHFYETNDDPIAQFKNFTRVVELKSGDLPPVIDIEKLHSKDDIKITENFQKFINALEAHYGVKPIIYSGFNFANEYLTNFGEYPLWLAEYNEADKPKLPKGWDDWTFWQWSQSEKITGISGNVDSDRYNGDEASFKKLLIK